VSLLDFAQNLKSGFRFFYRNTDKQIMASATITEKKLYRQNHETVEKKGEKHSDGTGYQETQKCSRVSNSFFKHAAAGNHTLRLHNFDKTVSVCLSLSMIP
jgi:hypothetical protein